MNVGYAVRGEMKNKKSTMTLMHRSIMKAPTGMEVDHINGNRLDNRKENLRICTHAQNCYNYKNKGNSTKGVHWEKHANKWRARIRYNGQKIHLGYFKSQKDALDAYNSAAKKYHGEFVNLDSLAGT